MPAGATIIGRVAVKVIPDTDDFYEDTRAKLEALEKKLPAVDIGFDAKVADAVKEVEEAVSAAQKTADRRAIKLRFDEDNQHEIERAIRKIDEQLDKYKPRTELTVDLNEKELLAAKELLNEQLDQVRFIDLDIHEGSVDHMRRALASVENELAKMESQKVYVHMDEDSLRKAAEDFRSTIAAMTNNIDIRYNPDSVDSVNAQLRSIEQEIAKLDEVNLKVDLDRDSLESARTSLQSIADAHIREQIDLDNKAFADLQRKVAAAVNDATKNLDPNIESEVAAQVRRGVEKAQRRVEELKLQITPELSEREKHRLQEEINDLEAKIGVDIDSANKKYAQAQLALLTRRRNASIVPVVEKGAAAKAAAALAALSGGRGVFNLGDDFLEWVGGLDRAAPRIAATNLAVLNLTSSIAALSSNMLAFGGSVASIAGATLALPGVFGGMAIGAGATVAVLKDFNTILPGVASKFHDLQDSMSEKFWAVAKAPMQDFINTIFPQFQRGLNDTSVSLGGFFANLAKSGNGQFNGELRSMFDDLNKSIDISSKYTDNFMGIIEKLGSVGAGNLPRLSKWFGDVAQNFDQWLGAKGQKGLQEYVDTGVSALQDLGNVLRYTGSTLEGLASAAEKAGGGTLAGLASTMESVARAVHRADFQRNLTMAFEGAHEAMSEIALNSGPQFRSLIERIAHLMGSLLPQAGETLGKALGGIFDALDQNKVERSVLGFFENIDKAVDQLLPTLPGVADALASIVDVLGDVTVNVARGLAPLLESLAPAVVNLADRIDPLVEQLGELLENLGEIGGPAVAAAVDSIGSLAEILAGILTPINGFLDAVEGLPGPLKSLVGALAGGAAAFALFNSAIGGVRTKVSGMVGRFKEAETRTVALKNAMSNAAGMAGMAGLAVGAQHAGDKIGFLANTAGGALTGFAVGGPWGAAIGAGAGAMLALSQNTQAANEAFRAGLDFNAAYIDSLNQVTGAVTELTRKTVYENFTKDDTFTVSRMYGIPDRDVVDAAIGNVKAIERVKKRLNKAIKNGTLDPNFKSDFLGSLAADRKEIERGNREIDRRTAATKGWGKALASIPKGVRVKLRQEGFDPTLKTLRKIATEGKGLSNKQIKLILKETGSKFTLDQIKGVGKAADDVGKKKPKVKVDADTKDANGKINSTDQLVQELVNKPRSPIHVNADTSGATGPINYVKSLLAGLHDKTVTIRTVHAISYANKQQDILNQRPGGRVAIDPRMLVAPNRAIDDAARITAVRFSLHFYNHLDKQMDKAMSHIAARLKKVDGQKDKALRKQRQHLKHIAGQYTSQMKTLLKVKDTLKQLNQEAKAYAQSVKDAIVATGDPTQIGATSFDAIKTGMEIARDEAVAFADVMEQLKGKLNKDTFQQIVAAGPEAGLATAQAILASGKDGIDALNDLAGQIRDAGKDLGATASDAVFGGQIAEATKQWNQLAHQIKPLQRRLEKLIDKMMSGVAKHVRKGNKKVHKELRNFAPPSVVAPHPVTAKSAAQNAKQSAATAGSGTTNVLNYYAAPGPQISSEEQLFAASERGRMLFTK